MENEITAKHTQGEWGVAMIDGGAANDEIVTVVDVAKCERCGANPVEEPHACPYAQDIGGSTDNKYCTCCMACTHECAMDI